MAGGLSFGVMANTALGAGRPLMPKRPLPGTRHHFGDVAWGKDWNGTRQEYAGGQDKRQAAEDSSIIEPVILKV